MGKVHYDEGINLLNQKEARVYMQSLGAEQITTLGSAVALHLTLEGEKSQSAREVAAKEAAEKGEALTGTVEEAVEEAVEGAVESLDPAA